MKKFIDRLVGDPIKDAYNEKKREIRALIRTQKADRKTLKSIPRAALRDADEEGYTPAWFAVMYDQATVLEYLHFKGVDLREPCDKLGVTPMMLARSKNKMRCLHILRQLLVATENERTEKQEAAAEEKEEEEE